MMPVAMHHDCQVLKVIFQKQCVLTLKEEKALRDISIFAVPVYLKAWMTASLSADAQAIITSF